QTRVPARSVKGLFEEVPVAVAVPLDPLPEGAKAPAPAPVAKQVEDLVELVPVEPVEDLVDLEPIEPEPPKKPAPPKKEKKAPVEILAEAEVTYREGLPDLDGPVAGTLSVESGGLRFLYDEEDEYYISFEKVDNVLEPVKGDFPQTMKRKALGAK